MSVTKEEIDDLDDLDDLLDDFDESALPPISDPVAGSTIEIQKHASTSANALPDVGAEDFAKQLQLGMEDLMKELDTSPEARKDFEQLMAQMNAATIDPNPAPTTSYPNNAKNLSTTSSTTTTDKATKTPKNFQESIEANLKRMKDSEASASQSSAIDAEALNSESDAFMAEMMKQFQDSAGGDGDFGKVLEGMMSQLMSKEILYEPLLELHQKYPAWLADHSDDPRVSEYRQQAALVKEIIEKFEDRDYRDENKEKKEEVMELMSKMQELGSPPKEIMGDDLGVFDPANTIPDGDCSIM